MPLQTATGAVTGASQLPSSPTTHLAYRHPGSRNRTLGRERRLPRISSFFRGLLTGIVIAFSVIRE